MKRVILLSQLICISMLFAPRDSRVKLSIAPREIPPIASRQMQSSLSRSLPSSPSKEEMMPLTGLDRAMFKHWYRDCFKTKEIDGITYFMELPERETKSPFVLMGMSTHTHIASLSVSLPGNVGAAQSIFRTSNGRPIRLKYTIRQRIESGEVKDMFNTMIPKLNKMTENMLDELYDAYDYGYEDHLPLDTIEVQDESGIIYLTCGIAQESSVSKNYLISEPECIRIRIKASNQCPESRMSIKHLVAQLPTSCPEFYMSRRYLGMYHAIYSALNKELVESLKGISKFPKVEGYSQISDSLREREWFNKVQETIEYLEEGELEPSIHIPTYQHDMLMDSEKSYKPLVLQTEESSDKAPEITDHTKKNEVEVEPSPEIPVYQYDTLGENVDYGSLVFTRDPSNGHCKSEVVNGLQCELHSSNLENSLGNAFRLSDLANNKVDKSSYSEVSFFCPAPGKFKQSSGNTKFTYSMTKIIPISEAINYLKVISHKLKKYITQLSKIESVEFPLESMSVWEMLHKDDHSKNVPISVWQCFKKRYWLTIYPSDEGKKLNPKSTICEGPSLHFHDI